MKRATVLTVAVLLSTSSALGGTVRFEPPVQVVNLGAPVSTVSFDIVIEEPEVLPEFDALDLYFGLVDLRFIEFVFDPDFIAASTLFGDEYYGNSVSENTFGYEEWLHMGGFSPGGYSVPLSFGTITFDVSDLPVGSYLLEVYSDALPLSALAIGLATEPLFGQANVVVVGSESMECLADADCNDGNLCTDDLCFAGLCGHPFNTVNCDDLNDCTEADVCAHGACEGLPVDGCCLIDEECDDADLCTDDWCVNHVCVHDFGDAACDDGDLCTDEDRCETGSCTGVPIAGCCVTNPECYDGNSCTDDWCENNVCFNDPHAGPCDDGNPCTDGDECVDALCAGVINPDCCLADDECQDQNDCTLDQCVGNACAHTFNASPCDDENPCTSSDACSNGVCVGQWLSGCCRTAEDCDDDNGCTLDECAIDECVYSTLEGGCDDGNACTIGDTCVDGLCGGSPIEDCCLADGECADGNPCTDDLCIDNECAGVPIAECCGSNADCDDESICTLDWCIDEVCVYWFTTTPCDDADLCTFDDQCVVGVCQGAPVDDCCHIPDECDDGDMCTDNQCIGNQCVFEATEGCCHDRDDCDDADACTDDDCLDSTCVHAPIPDCDEAAGGGASGEIPPEQPVPPGDDEVDDEAPPVLSDSGKDSLADVPTDSTGTSGQQPDSVDEQDEDPSLRIAPSLCGVMGAVTWSFMFFGLFLLRRLRFV